MTRTAPRRADGGVPTEIIDPTVAAASSLPAAPTRATQIVEPTQDEHPADEQTMLRIEHLPREAGWVLITAGVIGLVVPGIIGAPFLVAGAFVLTPGGPRRLSRWAGRTPPRFVHSALRQIGRLLDDLERRYPHRSRTDAQ
jgi:hypothetical protein